VKIGVTTIHVNDQAQALRLSDTCGNLIQIVALDRWQRT
jgi:hypothetical protein